MLLIIWDEKILNTFYTKLNISVLCYFFMYNKDIFFFIYTTKNSEPSHDKGEYTTTIIRVDQQSLKTMSTRVEPHNLHVMRIGMVFSGLQGC